jgi:ATP-binding cassette subfamily F protein uup
VLIVSHDRDFLDRTVTITLGLDGSGRVDIVAGGYEDWAKRRRSVAVPAKKKAPVSQDAVKAPTPAARVKLSYKDQRDLDRLPGEIERIEREIAAAEVALHDPDLFAQSPVKFAALTAELTRLRTEKDAAEERWLEVAAMAEELAG